MPLTWFTNLASIAREEGRVRDDIALRLLMDVSHLISKHTKYLYCQANAQEVKKGQPKGEPQLSRHCQFHHPKFMTLLHQWDSSV